MLNVCFGDSEAGTLKNALRGEEVTFGYRALELGAIHPDYFESARKNWIDEFFSICSKRERTKIWEQEKERVAKIIEAAKSEKELRIWYASSPCSICGYYKTVDMLQGIDCKIYVVELPESVGDRKPPYQNSWGAVYPEQMAECLSYQRELSQDERKEISQKWKTLEQDDSGLRLNIDGTVKNVPKNYLDDEILSYAPTDKPFKFGFLVGNVLGKSIHAVSDSFIADRVEAMINAVKIIVVERAKKPREYYYKTILRVATEQDLVELRGRYQFIENYLKKLDVDMYAILEALSDENREKSYAVLKKYPNMTKKQAMRRLKIEEYIPNPLPPGERTYTDADFKKRKKPKHKYRKI